MVHLRHNIISILYVIQGLSESHLIRSEEGRFDNPDERLIHAEFVLKKILDQASAALQIIRRLGRVLRIESQIEKRFCPVSVGESWKRTLRILQEQHFLGQLEIIERIPDPFPRIRCQRKDFEDILYALVHNAADAMTGTGKLIIRAELTYSVREEPSAVIKVTDTGPGISGLRMRNLFQPFYTTKSNGKGNGLGLYLVKELVERNGGKIMVSSFENCGTTFSIYFPLAEKRHNPSRAVIKQIDR